MNPQADSIGNIAGGLLKSIGTIQAGTGLWEAPNTDATNSSGFPGLPGGFRNANGSFGNIGFFGSWWSSTQFSSTDGWYRNLGCNFADVGRFGITKTSGISVRCVRD